MRGNRWNKSVLKELREYVDATARPSVSGLSISLGVSRQCIYDWSDSHPDFRKALNNMRHDVINILHVKAEDFIDPLDEQERKAKISARRARKAKAAKEAKEAETAKDNVAEGDLKVPSGDFVDELGDDDDWDIVDD